MHNVEKGRTYTNLEAYTACRLIPLGKKPGVKPIGVSEVLWRIIGKAIPRLLPNGSPREPEDPKIYPQATIISNREPEPKTYDSQAKFRWTNNKIPCSFYTFETKTKSVWSSAVGEKIFPPIEGKQTSTCLEIRFCDFCCSEVLVWKWRRMNLKVFEKPSILKSLLFPCVRKVRSLLREVKTDKKSRSVEMVSNYTWHTLLLLVLSILLRTRTVHPEVSFITYSALSAPPYFCCTFCGNFWKVRKNIPVFENDSRRLLKSIIISTGSFHRQHNGVGVGEKKRKERKRLCTG